MTLASAAAGQDSGSLRLGVLAGTAFPVSPEEFRTEWNVGFGFGFGGDIRIRPLLAATVSGEYERFPLDRTAFIANESSPDTALTNVSGGPIDILAAHAGLKVQGRGARLQPFVHGGVGVAHVWWNQITATLINTPVVVPSSGETQLAFQLGAGVDVPLRPRGPDLEFDVAWSPILTENAATHRISARVGVRFR